MAKLTSEQIDNITLKSRELNVGTPQSIIDAANTCIAVIVPHVGQHDLHTCCGTTASAKQNLAYVKQLEDKVKFMDSLIEAYQCDTLYQFARHVSMLAVRCEVLTQQVNQLKGSN